MNRAVKKPKGDGCPSCGRRTCQCGGQAAAAYLLAATTAALAAPAAVEADLRPARFNVSIITPCRDGEAFLQEAIDSVLAQTHAAPMEWVVFDDGSADGSAALLEAARPSLAARAIHLLLLHGVGPARGVGGACNAAIAASSGEHYCFLDADDIMAPARIEHQLAASIAHPGALIGCGFDRLPVGATPRYTTWLNGLCHEQLSTQWLREVTLARPTWFCHRAVFAACGPFYHGPRQADDLRFFLAHVARGGGLVRVPGPPLLTYRHHEGSSVGDALRGGRVGGPAAPPPALGVPQELIWALRVTALQQHVLPLPPWCAGFTIWSTGKQGRRLYRALAPVFRAAVVAFCDTDSRRTALGVYAPGYDATVAVPVIHYSMAKPPLIICVKHDLTGGGFEAALASLNLREGVDYIHFA